MITAELGRLLDKWRDRVATAERYAGIATSEIRREIYKARAAGLSEAIDDLEEVLGIERDGEPESDEG